MFLLYQASFCLNYRRNDRQYSLPATQLLLLLLLVLLYTHALSSSESLNQHAKFFPKITYWITNSRFQWVRCAYFSFSLEPHASQTISKSRVSHPNLREKHPITYPTNRVAEDNNTRIKNRKSFPDYQRHLYRRSWRYWVKIGICSKQIASSSGHDQNELSQGPSILGISCVQVRICSEQVVPRFEYARKKLRQGRNTGCSTETVVFETIISLLQNVENMSLAREMGARLNALCC